MDETGTDHRQSTFYHSMRPLAGLCKIMGVLPLKNVTKNNTRKLHFKLLSIDVFMSVLLHSLAAALSFFSGLNCFELTFTPFAALRATIMMVIPCIFSDKISQLCKAIEDYDHILAKRKILIHSWKVHWLAWLSLAIGDAIILVIAACNKRLLLPLLASQNIVVAVSKNMSTIARDLYLIKYLFFCYNLKIRFDAVNDRFSVLVCQHISSSVKSMVVDDEDDDDKRQTPYRGKTIHCIHESQKVVVGIANGEDKQMFRKVVYDVLALDFIEETRLQYTKLSRAVKLLNAAYGLFIGAYLFLITFALLIDLYYFFYVKGNSLIDVVRSIAGNGALLVLLALFSDDLSSAAHEVLDHLRELPLESLTADQKIQVQVFTTQLMASPVQVSASGFCVVNKMTLVSVVMGVTMYFIILVQFSEDLKSYTDKFINMTTWDHPNC